MRLTLLAASLLTITTSLRAQSITIDNVTIVDVATGRLQARKSIVIEGKRIARIENATAATRAAATLDGTGMFVIPGLWDMHIHAYFTNDTARFHSTNNVMFPLFIVNGVTGGRDLGSNLEATLAARDSVTAHQMIGPRMLVSGPMIDGPTSRYAAAIKVAPGDAGAFATGLKSLMTDRKLRKRLEAASWTAGRKLPTWHETARRIFIAVTGMGARTLAAGAADGQMASDATEATVAADTSGAVASPKTTGKGKPRGQPA